jgi:hypothetical protein
LSGRLWCPVLVEANGALVGGAARTVAGLETVDEATDRARPAACEAGADSGDSRGCVLLALSSVVSSSGDLIANGLLIELPNSPGMVKVGKPKSGLGISGR